MGGLVDAQTLRQLFVQHGPAVYRRALRLLGDRADAEEATQEVFIRAMKGADGFAGLSQVTTWLYQITTHYCLNQLRDRGRRRELFDQGFAPTDEQDSAAAPADLILLRRLLAQADEQQARAAICVFLDGMTHEEAAEVLGVAKRTVGNLLERFRAWANQHTADPAPAPAKVVSS